MKATSPHRHGRRTGCRAAASLTMAGLTMAGSMLLSVTAAVPARAAVQMDGTGSTYVALAMSQWVGDIQQQGLNMNYTPTGSPTGVNFFLGSTVDFAGTEAEVSSLTSASPNLRSYQYIPDVAGATAIMYNVRDAAGRKVDYLHLSRRTVAAIFVGAITNWNDPQISRENLGVKLEDHPITVVYRSGQSGTTALFYDFVANTAPDLWQRFKAANHLPDRRIVELPPQALPRSRAESGSDQIAQTVADDRTGAGAIAYDEFGYAKAFNVPTAWIQNAAGKWVQPYAVNISAALDRARLRPDLSQELTGVYGNPNPKTYPISAYSYIMTPCAPASDRTTCKTPFYSNEQAQSMAKFLRHIACDGQVKMAQLGYSPLPPVLSQEMVRSINRMSPATATSERLTAANCRNPRFHGSLGAGAESPPDPFATVDPEHFGTGTGTGGTGTGGPGGNGTTGGSGGTGTSGAGGIGTSAGSGSTAGARATQGASTQAGPNESAATAAGAQAGVAGQGAHALGGSGDWRDSEPVDYRGADSASMGTVPAAVLLLLLAVPPATFVVISRLRGSRWSRRRG